MSRSLSLSTGLFEEVRVKLIYPPVRPLRFDLGTLDGLINSIKEKGLLHPIVVRPMGGKFEVVSGARRLESCKRLKLAKIPCHIVELDDKEAFEISILENVQRKSLETLEEAQAFKDYVVEYGYGGITNLARRIGKSQEYVSRKIQLLDLPDGVKREITRQRINPSIAQELISMDRERAGKMAKIICEQGLSSREVRRLLRQHQNELKGDDKSLFFDVQYTDPGVKKREEMTDKAFVKCITSLKIYLMRLSDALEYVEDNFITREVLLEHRLDANQMIDLLYKMRKKAKNLPLDAL